MVYYVHQQTGHGLADFLFRGTQLYKTTLLQVLPFYLLDLRKRPFHAGLRGVLMKRLAAF